MINGLRNRSHLAGAYENFSEWGPPFSERRRFFFEPFRRFCAPSENPIFDKITY